MNQNNSTREANANRRGWSRSAALGFGLLLLTTAGCQWVGFSSHTNPEVRGRVVDGVTHQPLADVKVNRVMRGQVVNPGTPPNGAQLLQQERPLATDTAGDFIYPSQSYMTLLREARWWSLKLSFQRAGYATLQTNFTLANVNTNLPDGTPVVLTGDIFLQPLKK